jgi:peptidylprolyl isomerase
MRNLFLILLLSTSLHANVEMQKLSEALGHLLGKHLEELNVPIDLSAIAKGMEDRAAGLDSPLPNEVCLKEISKIQEKKNKEIEQKNLVEADQYLSQNKQKENIQTLIDGKLQMQVIREGTGLPLLADQAPVIRLSGRYLNGEPFLEEENETFISLDESTPAFQKGLEGMVEGEIRTLYVHPTIGFNDLAPNALQIFEVELIRADTAADEQIALESYDTLSLQ